MRIALLHIAPVVGDIEHNRRLLEASVAAAAGLGAEWIVTPELCLSGYDFVHRLGAGWIEPQPDRWMSRFLEVVAKFRVTVFLGHAEKDAATGRSHNSVFAIGPDGSILGAHRKQAVIPVVEAWSSPGDRVAPIAIPGHQLNAGVLICADAYTSRVAGALKEAGAHILISPAAWPPTPHGPGTSWEDRSRETGLPLFVCNRTGNDDTLDFRDSESVVVSGGRRLLTFSSPESSIALVDFDMTNSTIFSYSSHKVE